MKIFFSRNTSVKVSLWCLHVTTVKMSIIVGNKSNFLNNIERESYFNNAVCVFHRINNSWYFFFLEVLVMQDKHRASYCLDFWVRSLFAKVIQLLNCYIRLIIVSRNSNQKVYATKKSKNKTWSSAWNHIIWHFCVVSFDITKQQILVRFVKSNSFYWQNLAAWCFQLLSVDCISISEMKS